MFGWGVYKTCYRIGISDGYLAMCYLYKRRGVRLDQVRRIEFIQRVEGCVTTDLWNRPRDFSLARSPWG